MLQGVEKRCQLCTDPLRFRLHFPGPFACYLHQNVNPNPFLQCEVIDSPIHEKRARSHPSRTTKPAFCHATRMCISIRCKVPSHTPKDTSSREAASSRANAAPMSVHLRAGHVIVESSGGPLATHRHEHVVSPYRQENRPWTSTCPTRKFAT